MMQVQLEQEQGGRPASVRRKLRGWVGGRNEKEPELRATRVRVRGGPQNRSEQRNTTQTQTGCLLLNTQREDILVRQPGRPPAPREGDGNDHLPLDPEDVWLTVQHACRAVCPTSDFPPRQGSPTTKRGGGGGGERHVNGRQPLINPRHPLPNTHSTRAE